MRRTVNFFGSLPNMPVANCILFISLLFTSCKTLQATSPQSLEVNKDSMLLYHAKTPYHVSADSLLHFLKSKVYRNYGRFSEKVYTEYEKNLNSFNPHLYAEAYRISQDYLINKFSPYVYSKYVYFFDQSFKKPESNEDNFHIKFIFYIPTVTKKQPNSMDTSLAAVLYTFNVRTQGNAILSIENPEYVPDCKGLPDCGFVISRDSAIAIAKQAGIIEEGDKYKVEIAPLLPEVDLSLVDWLLIVDKVNQQGIFITAKINIQTGEVYDKKELHAIDTGILQH